MRGYSAVTPVLRVWSLASPAQRLLLLKIGKTPKSMCSAVTWSPLPPRGQQHAPAPILTCFRSRRGSRYLAPGPALNSRPALSCWPRCGLQSALLVAHCFRHGFTDYFWPSAKAPASGAVSRRLCLIPPVGRRRLKPLGCVTIFVIICSFFNWFLHCCGRQHLGVSSENSGNN